MGRLIFLNRFFHPDHSATSQILSDLAFHLAGCGTEVHVITSQQRYDQPAARLPAEETVNGVIVHRVPTTQFGRSALLGRGLDYASYYRSTRRMLRSLVQRDDVIVAKTDPPLVGVIAMGVARRRGAHLINWLQDVYPEVAVELGVPLLRGPLARGLTLLRDRSVHQAVANVAVGERMAGRIKGSVPRAKVQVIPNWCNDEAITPVRAADNPLRREWGLAEKFVVGYSGNLGRAHEYETVLGAAERLRSHPRIVFLFIGGGHHIDELARRVRAQNLEHLFRFMPYQDRLSLKHSLSVPDAHWISLRPEVEGLLVPSKFYGIAAVGRPIIAICAKDGEIGALVQQHGCGMVVAPGDAQELAERLNILSMDPGFVSHLGNNARVMLDRHFTRRQAIERWSALINGI